MDVDERSRANDKKCEVPSDIVLGPPKIAFASASAIKTAIKPVDSPNRSRQGAFDNNFTKHEDTTLRRSHNDREKRNDEQEGLEEPRSGTIYSRRNGKEDGDSWESLRSGKSFGMEDGQRTYRRNGEREYDTDRVDSRNHRRLQQKGFDSHRRGDETTTTHRHGVGRGARSSWYRDNEGQGGQVPEVNREGTRGRDWREGERPNRRGADREWNKGGRVEQDPEWMVEPEAEDKKQSYTVDDMEKWKASMKASKAQMEPSVVETASSQDLPMSGTLPPVGSRKVETPLVLDPTVDKFFGLWNLAQSNEGLESGVKDEDKLKHNAKAFNAPKSSRFTGFFGPKPEAAPSEPEPAPPPLPPPISTGIEKNSSSEDKEGFQRILQMLGSGNLLGSDVDSHPFNQTLSSFNITQRPHKASTPPREKSPDIFRASPPIHSPRSRRSIGLESLLGPQSPREGPIPQNKDSEFLLQLMQQKGSDIDSILGGSQRLPAGNAPGIPPYPNMAQAQSVQQHSNQGFRLDAFGDPVIGDLRPRDKLNPNAQPSKAAQMLPVSDPYVDMPMTNSRRPSVPMVPQHYGPPPGLQRPPGFEQLPPGYQLMQQQQRANMPVPPPGFSHPNRNPNPFPPGLIPNLSNPNISNDRSILGFGMRQVGAPPPGFIGNNGPPPGFASMPMPPDGRISPTRMFFGGGGGGGGIPQRHPFMDSFGDPNGKFGLAGRGLLPGQYRRPE